MGEEREHARPPVEKGCALPTRWPFAYFTRIDFDATALKTTTFVSMLQAMLQARPREAQIPASDGDVEEERGGVLERAVMSQLDFLVVSPSWRVQW
jgi:hypothetical protein